MPAYAECFLFEAQPEDVVREIERVGACRDTEANWCWHLDAVRRGALYFWLQVRSEHDARRLELPDTIEGHILGDWVWPASSEWFSRLAAALHSSREEAEKLAMKNARVWLTCKGTDQAAADAICSVVTSLMRRHDGIVVAGGRAWGAAQLRVEPESLQLDIRDYAE